MKLKPAKQALADAIHQNGGWRSGSYAVYGKRSGNCTFLTCKPKYQPEDQGWFVMFSWIVGEFEMKPFVNWHQTILSRDEYFSAYPEQVKVAVNNETSHKVEVEMKSEQEMTIMVSDWHKNGELPPVGEVCEAEYNTTPAVWESVRVIGFDDCECVFMWISGDKAGLIGAYSHPKDFRPLRAERDRAIDEIISTAKKIGWNSEMANQIIGEVAVELYEAGYRKEVK